MTTVLMPGYRTSVDCRPGGAVSLCIEMEVARSPKEVWEVVGDLPRFVCIDPFHCRLVVLGPMLEPGVEIGLLHGFRDIGFWRYGRLLTWDEGHSYSFSDLSSGGASGLFPHVFFIRVEPARTERPGHTLLTVRVRGRWKPEWVPRALRRPWLTFVSGTHAWLLHREFRRIFHE